MSFVIEYPERGRGAWPSSGTGGTYSSDGSKPGRFYRAPAKKGDPMIGLLAFRAVRDGTPCSLDHYATYRAVMALQEAFGLTPDGLWGPITDTKVKDWQAKRGLKPDGVFGPKSARQLFQPLCAAFAQEVDRQHAGDIAQMVAGHVNLESMWDPAAIGVLTPQDVGLGQINGLAHPSVSLDQRLDPMFSIQWMVSFVEANFKAMGFNVRDAVAAYNLGLTGARNWIKDGRPDVWVREGRPEVKVSAYIDKVLSF